MSTDTNTPLARSFAADPESDRTYTFEQRAMRNQPNDLRRLAMKADACNDPARFEALMHDLGVEYWNLLMKQADHDHTPQATMCYQCKNTEVKHGQRLCDYCIRVRNTEYRPGESMYERSGGR